MIGASTSSSPRSAIRRARSAWPSIGRSIATARAEFLRAVGRDFERHLLLALGYAARMYPKVWAGLETDRPVGFALNLDEAFAFLKEDAWVLEDAGYTVIVPSWWTPAGRRRAKIRLKTAAHTGKQGVAAAGNGLLSLDTIIAYEYQLSIGGEVVTEAEWRRLIDAKTPLVRFRGEWMELDRDKMRQMLEFWQTRAARPARADAAGPAADRRRAGRRARVGPRRRRARDAGPPAGQERPRADAGPAQPARHAARVSAARRRLAAIPGKPWPESLSGGRHGTGQDRRRSSRACSMSRRTAADAPPTLIIAPTSVLGTGARRSSGSRRDLRALVHQGSGRAKQEAAFQAACAGARRGHHLLRPGAPGREAAARRRRGTAWWSTRRRTSRTRRRRRRAPSSSSPRAHRHGPHRHAGREPPARSLVDLQLPQPRLPRQGGAVPQVLRVAHPARTTTGRARPRSKKLVEPFILRRVKTDKQHHRRPAGQDRAEALLQPDAGASLALRGGRQGCRRADRGAPRASSGAA